MGVTQRELADAIAVPYQRVNEIVNRRRGITPSTALRLAEFFGTSSGFWLNLQARWDLYHAQRAEADELKRIRRHEPPATSAKQKGAGLTSRRRETPKWSESQLPTGNTQNSDQNPLRRSRSRAYSSRRLTPRSRAASLSASRFGKPRSCMRPAT